MAKGDTKTNQYLDIAARGTRADLQRGCCNTRTQDLIMDVAERIITEEETRYREDQILQSEIDEIKNNPDVYDIVATYADLQNYDTSTITDKDVIRVLRDETHDNASTYYRWDAADQEFDYIGETGDYYTKAQVNALLALKADKATTYTKTETDALLDGKQDVLTAGENIAIEDESGSLVISAADTTYSDFTGTDGTAAGIAGLVPAPATTDAGKFLKADGTWDSAGGGSGGITELTSADYDYPDDSPDGVALWRLDGGLYYVSDGTTKLYTNNITSSTPVAQTTLLLIRNPAPNAQAISIIRQTNGTDVPHAYVTNINNGNGIVLNKSLGGPTVNDTLTSTSTSQALSANQGKVLKDLIDGLAISGAGAPTTSTVGTVGKLYEDTTNGKLYICTDTTGGTYTWVEVGGGSGPTVVQTTGTSTTDVMSQNAVTSMVFADPSTKYRMRIGTGSSTTTDHGIAIGNDATARAAGAIAIGRGADAYTQGQMDIGTYLTSSGYNNSNYRLLTGVYDGQSAHDAATYGQVISYSAINGAGAPTTATEGKYVGQLYYDTTNEAMYFLKTIDTTTTPATYTWELLGGGSSVNVVQTTGTSTTDVMSQNAVTSMVFADPSTRGAVRIGNTKNVYAGSVGIGRISGTQYSGASGSFSVAIGSDVSASTNGAVSIGKEADVRGIALGAIALGAYSKATSAGEMNIGSSDTSYGYNSSNYRLLTGLYDPQSAHDAATKGYCDNAIINGGTTAPTTATVGAVGTQYTYVDTTGTHTAHLCVCTEIDTTDPSTPVYTWQTLI